MTDPILATLLHPDPTARILASEKLEQDEKHYLLSLVILRELMFAERLTLEQARKEVRSEDMHHFESMAEAVQLFGKKEKQRAIVF